MFWFTTTEKSVPPNINYRLHLRGKSLGNCSWCGIYVLFSHAESKCLLAEYCSLYSGTANARSSVSRDTLSALSHLLFFLPCSRDFGREGLSFHFLDIVQDWEWFPPAFPPWYTALLTSLFPPSKVGQNTFFPCAWGKAEQSPSYSSQLSEDVYHPSTFLPQCF